MDHGEFTGERPNVFQNNLIHSTAPRMIRSNGRLLFDHNLYWYTGRGEPRWSYGGRDYRGFGAFREGSGQEFNGLVGDPQLSATLRPGRGSPAVDAGAPAVGSVAHDSFGTLVPQGRGPDIGAVEREAPAPEGGPRVLDELRGEWGLISWMGADDTSRSQLVFLHSALEQYGERGLVVAVGFPRDVPATLASDWNLGRIRSLGRASPPGTTLPTTLIVAPDGQVVRRWEGFAPPADLGLALRSLIGPPVGSAPVELAPDGPVDRR
jgi:hypothetical protein